MRKLLAVILSVGMLAVFTGVSAAQKQSVPGGHVVGKPSSTTQPSGGPMQATTVKGSKSNADNRSSLAPNPGAPVGIAVSDPGSPADKSTKSQKRICLVYKPGHQGDDRYCSQSVPAP